MKHTSMCSLTPASESHVPLMGTFLSFSPKKLKRAKTLQAPQASPACSARTARTAALRTACTMLGTTSMWSPQRPACSRTSSALRDCGKILLVSAFSIEGQIGELGLFYSSLVLREENCNSDMLCLATAVVLQWIGK